MPATQPYSETVVAGKLHQAVVQTLGQSRHHWVRLPRYCLALGSLYHYLNLGVPCHEHFLLPQGYRGHDRPEYCNPLSRQKSAHDL